MPHSVQASTNLVVMPYSLCTSFRRAMNIETLVNQYADGFRQVGLNADSFLNKWELGKRLTASQISALLTFLDARKGAAFYFYDVNETDPKYSYDATGAATTGRYIVHAEGNWASTLGIKLSDIYITLVEQI